MARTLISIVLGCIALIGIGIAFWIWLGADQALAPTNTAVQSAAPVRLSADETDPFKGDRGAPVTVIVASSFGCPACKEVSRTLDQLLALYPKDVRIVWKDLPEATGDSYRAALAGRCAQQQGRFWQYHDTLYTKQDFLATRELYGLWAGELGLKEDIFTKCLDEAQTKKLVDRSIQEVLATDIQGIPYFQINDEEPLEGVQNLGYLRGIVDSLLFATSTTPHL